MDLYGMITDIQRFSLHDGPGIRTSVFFKGCNLDCVWCHNPETISFEPDILLNPEKCIRCGSCSEGCFSGARRVVGKRYSLKELMAEVLQDKIFYGETGGVTLTGGEPACQADFAVAVLEACVHEGIGRAIETNLHYEQKILKSLASLCDLVICDLKIWDEISHKKWTGASNQLIKQNLEILNGIGVPFIVRTTIIPGINDTQIEIESIIDFLSGFTNIQFYELLSYSPLGLSKNLEGKEKRMAFQQPSKESMQELIKFTRKSGIPIRLDGIEVGAEN